MDERTLKLKEIAAACENMVRICGRRKDIRISFQRPSKEVIKTYSAWDRKHFALISGEEYFMISDPDGLLYVVNVTSDSLLTAASELMNLLGRKF